VNQILPVTLSSAAAMAILTIWLMQRCGRLRMASRIAHGDGGDALLGRRMRAQLNFVESAPFVLALIAAIELAGKGGLWLSAVAGIYVLGRIAHAIGMDSERANRARLAGAGIAMLTLLSLAICAALITARII